MTQCRKKGCKSVKGCADGALASMPYFVFIAPPNMETLEARLVGRGTETKEKIAVRLQNAKVFPSLILSLSLSSSSPPCATSAKIN